MELLRSRERHSTFTNYDKLSEANTVGICDIAVMCFILMDSRIVVTLLLQV
jgi:hypothetical protein